MGLHRGPVPSWEWIGRGGGAAREGSRSKAAARGTGSAGGRGSAKPRASRSLAPLSGSGRARAASVIDVGNDAGSVASAVCRALSSEFRDLARRTMNPYDTSGDGRVSERIAERLVDALRLGLTTSKRFNDLGHVSNGSGAS